MQAFAVTGSSSRCRHQGNHQAQLWTMYVCSTVSFLQPIGAPACCLSTRVTAVHCSPLRVQGASEFVLCSQHRCKTADTCEAKSCDEKTPLCPRTFNRPGDRACHSCRLTSFSTCALTASFSSDYMALMANTRYATCRVAQHQSWPDCSEACCRKADSTLRSVAEVRQGL